MDLYLAADSGRLQQAMTCTAHLAHMSYRLGSDGTLLASPLPDTLRGGLLMLSDEDGAYPEAPEGLCRRLLQECLHRRYAGVILDAAPPENFCRTLDELLFRQGRKLFLPEKAAQFAPHGTAVVCTACTSGSLEDKLAEAAEHWGAEHLALDLQRMMIDFPLSASGGDAVPLTPDRLHRLAEGRPTYFSRPLCARYFTYHTDGGSRFVLFDDAQTLKSKMETAEKLGIRQGFFMLPEVEDLLSVLFAPVSNA